MEEQFTEDQLNIASLKLAADNNALLRIILQNQVRIMDKLEVDHAVDRGIYSSLIPSMPESGDLNLQQYVKAVQLLSSAVLKSVKIWVELNGKTGGDGDS